MSFRGVELIARDGIVENPVQRIAAVKSFFYPFRLVDWLAYAYEDMAWLSQTLRSIAAPFVIPKALSRATLLCHSGIGPWKKAKAGADLIGAGSKSLLWIDRQVVLYRESTFLGPAFCLLLERTVAVAKVVSASWVITNAAYRLGQLAGKQPSSTWEGKELWRKVISRGLALAKGVMKLLVGIGAILVTFGGVFVSPFLFLGLYTVVLMITLAKRFFEREKRFVPYLGRGKFVCV